MSALEEELGSTPPRGLLDAIDERRLEELAGALRSAREHQREALDAALLESLQHVPRLLRGPVKRIIFG